MAAKKSSKNALAQFDGFIEDKRGALAQVLAAGVDADRWVSVAKSVVSTKSDLLNCVPLTLYSCIHDAAKLNLSLDPQAGEFWLIPRWNRDLGANECTGLIGYKGFITLGKRSGVISHIETRCVFKDEVERNLVEIEFGHGKLRHEHCWTGIDRSDDAVVGVYAAAFLPDSDRPCIEPLTRDQVDKRMRSSATTIKEGRPWHDWYQEMARKTAVRALFGRGYFPLTLVCATPRGPSEGPVSLGEAVRIDDGHADTRERLEEPTKITVEVAGEADEPPPADAPVPAGTVAEEEQPKEAKPKDDKSKKGKAKKDDPPPSDEAQQDTPALRLQHELTRRIGKKGDTIQDVTLWFESQLGWVFKDPWDKLDEKTRNGVVETLRRDWSLEDFFVGDKDLPARLEEVWLERGMSAVRVVTISEELGVPWDGQEASLKKMEPGALRVLINGVREAP